ncbi:MAG: PDZ domain-containing protein [Clostridiales bacterium]|nr:PDZ domain-containing protein [Clostridiales bacterium]
MTIILFFVIFGVIVIGHEFGHFLLGRMNGIGVVEFSVGMGPKLCSFTRKGTVYSLRLLPIGGACMFAGEDGAEMIHSENTGKSFSETNVWGRIATVAAGPVFNFILAFFLTLIIFGMNGVNKPTVSEIIPDSPAEAAGLLAGDEIVRINGERVHFFDEISTTLMFNEGKQVVITYMRDGKEYQTTLQPAFDEEGQYYYIGIYHYTNPEEAKVSGFEWIKYSFYNVGYQLEMTYKSLAMLIGGKVAATDMAGPVGMAQIVGDTYEATKDYGFRVVFFYMTRIAILLSVNIGFLNLMPLPALDGGRLVFMLVEVVRGKPVPPDKEGMVHFAGFVALMLFMVFVMYNDIARIFAG